MFKKMFDECGALCYGSLMLTTNMNKAGLKGGFANVQKAAPARSKRSVLSGGMFNHNSRIYRHS